MTDTLPNPDVPMPDPFDTMSIYPAATDLTAAALTAVEMPDLDMSEMDLGSTATLGVPVPASAPAPASASAPAAAPRKYCTPKETPVTMEDLLAHSTLAGFLSKYPPSLWEVFVFHPDQAHLERLLPLEYQIQACRKTHWASYADVYVWMGVRWAAMCSHARQEAALVATRDTAARAKTTASKAAADKKRAARAAASAFGAMVVQAAMTPMSDADFLELMDDCVADE